MPGRVEGANAWLNKRVAADGDDAQKNIERARVWQKHQQNHMTVSPWMFAIAWLGLSFRFYYWQTIILYHPFSALTLNTRQEYPL